MGNHEYCGDCGASDFHRGQPCNPARWAEHQKWLQEGVDYNKRREATERLAIELAALGYDCRMGLYCVEVRPRVV